jgi:glycosyltransferase involved in cell wall biosynthesis
MKTGILHYSVPPVVGGVEAVIQAQAAQFARSGLPLRIIAGNGRPEAVAPGVEGLLIPEIDTLNPQVLAVAAKLDQGILPEEFEPLTQKLVQLLEPAVAGLDHLIVHNVFTKHFNLPLSAALFRLLESGALRRAIAWCHDLTWTSPNSRRKVYDRYPWNLLKTPREDVLYVAISMARQKEVIDSFGLPPARVHVIYNGVDAPGLLGLSEQGCRLAERLGLWESDLNLLMPVRVTRAKNIEYALDFVAELKKLDCRPRLVLTGPPDPHDPDNMAYYQELREKRHKSGLDEEVCFVYECGPEAGQPYTISQDVVAELYRVCDVMFMPSHREGFGMPVLEAGLSGMPVVCTGIPAAVEIALEDVFVFSEYTGAERLAMDVLTWVEDNPTLRLRQRVRQNYTWPAIFKRDLLPLLEGKIK